MAIPNNTMVKFTSLTLQRFLQQVGLKFMTVLQKDELSFDLHDGEIMANIAEIPYGEYSVLIYEDYNFDGMSYINNQRIIVVL